MKYDQWSWLKQLEPMRNGPSIIKIHDAWGFSDAFKSVEMIYLFVYSIDQHFSLVTFLFLLLITHRWVLKWSFLIKFDLKS